MPNKRAADLKMYPVWVSEARKRVFLKACHLNGISGTEAIERFMDAVMKATVAGRASATVKLAGDGSRVPAPALKPRKKAAGT